MINGELLLQSWDSFKKNIRELRLNISPGFEKVKNKTSSDEPMFKKILAGIVGRIQKSPTALIKIS